MEEFKKISEILEIDKKHVLLSKVIGGTLNINLLHKILSEITLNDNVPEKIIGQFNVARNMALLQKYSKKHTPSLSLH